MKVRLTGTISGTRDGVAWPRVGSVVELPDDEAMSMLYAGTAKAVDPADAPEPVVTMPTDIDEAVERFIPETARHEPAVGIENLSDDDRRPNMDAIALGDDGEIGHGPSNLAAVDDEPVDMAETAKTGTPLTTSNGPTKVVRRSAPKK